VDDAILKQALQAVNLADLDERFGGFDADEDWGDVLSLGEQQRLTFARILLNQPAFAILDEATSALDLENEARLYDHLQNTGTTFVSVGHRESLNAFHQNVLELTEDQQTGYLGSLAKSRQSGFPNFRVPTPGDWLSQGIGKPAYRSKCELFCRGLTQWEGKNRNLSRTLIYSRKSHFHLRNGWSEESVNGEYQPVVPFYAWLSFPQLLAVNECCWNGAMVLKNPDKSASHQGNF
jgi:energy-coupling factor transporter ATP-binding protein EcfA2